MNHERGTDTPPSHEPWEKVVRDQVQRLRFGAVRITVHDGEITSVEATEKTRLEGAGSSGK